MIELLKSMILDFQEAPLHTGVPRRFDTPTVPGKATVCIGVRRSGKSTYLFQLMEKLLESGVPRENILYLNFFDDRLHGLDGGNLGLVTEAYYSLFPVKKGVETVHFFFDEIQAVPGWEPFVDRIMRTEKCEVYLTGSSARMLSKEIATQMRGRALSWEIFPFSFHEFLDSRGIEVDANLSSRGRLLVQKAFDQYWEVGGFPEISAQRTSEGTFQSMSDRLRVKTHQEYFQAIMFRDLVERHDISHPKAVNDLAHRLIDNIASLHSINKLSGHLKALGHGASKAALSDYMEWFEDAFFLFSMSIFDASISRRNVNPKKIYCIDHALVTSVSSGILVNSGHLLENLVFVTLRRHCSEIHYYRTKNGREVDFIVAIRRQPRLLVQVCETMVDPQTRKREINALCEAMAELGLKTGTIVTRNEEEEIKVDQGIISMMPAWRFLLEWQVENLDTTP